MLDEFFSMSTYLDKILKQFKMEQSKKEFLPVLQGVKLSKDLKPDHNRKQKENEKGIPYASVIGSVKYAMLCTRPIVYLTMSLARGYNSDPGVDYWTTVKNNPQWNKDTFLGYGGDKEFVVKGYVDASFDTDPDDSKSQSGYILKVGAISQNSSMQSMVDIENLQNTYGSECGRPVD